MAHYKLWSAPLLSAALILGTGSALAQYGPPGPPPPGYGQDRGGWDAPPSDYREIAQRGFRDGMDGARKDVENRRRPDVNNRDEYRNPSVDRRERREYRRGFKRGYDVAMSHLISGRRPGRY